LPRRRVRSLFRSRISLVIHWYRFYWKRRILKPAALEGETYNDTEISEEPADSLLKHDESDLQLMRHRSIVEQKKQDDMLMGRFSSQQKELLREIGGLPKDRLKEASRTFRHASGGARDPNPFRVDVSPQPARKLVPSNSLLTAHQKALRPIASISTV
jgi:hypothetical protein